MKVLVVDDEKFLRELIEYNLWLDGYDVVVAASATEGITLAREQRPDVILMDWMMPGINGLEAVAVLKRDRQTRPIPIFMLTARGQVADMERAFSVGADDYITKPFEPEKLGRQIAIKLKATASR